MGLYIKPNHPSIYKNDKQLSEPNQGFFIKSHIHEMIEEQKSINNTLEKSFHGLKRLYEAGEYKHLDKWNEFNKQITELKDMNTEQEIFEKNVMEQLKKLETENMKLQSFLETKNLSEQEMNEALAHLHRSQQTIATQLQDYGDANNQIMDKMDQQMTIQKQMTEQVTSQEQNNQEVLQRLDEQEALTERIIRQLDHFRSILFERTNFLSSKIEDVSTFVLNAISRSDELQNNRVGLHKEKEKVNK